MLIRWEAFCKKTLKISLDFSYVLEIIVILLRPVYGAIIEYVDLLILVHFLII